MSKLAAIVNDWVGKGVLVVSIDGFICLEVKSILMVLGKTARRKE
jgi:hypothetical protein